MRSTFILSFSSSICYVFTLSIAQFLMLLAKYCNSIKTQSLLFQLAWTVAKTVDGRPLTHHTASSAATLSVCRLQLPTAVRCNSRLRRSWQIRNIICKTALLSAPVSRQTHSLRQALYHCMLQNEDKNWRYARSDARFLSWSDSAHVLTSRGPGFTPPTSVSGRSEFPRRVYPGKYGYNRKNNNLVVSKILMHFSVTICM